MGNRSDGVESMIDGTVWVLLVGDGDEVLTIDPTLPHSHPEVRLIGNPSPMDNEAPALARLAPKPDCPHLFCCIASLS